jgi:hypothetical protein
MGGDRQCFIVGISMNASLLSSAMEKPQSQNGLQEEESEGDLMPVSAFKGRWSASTLEREATRKGNGFLQSLEPHDTGISTSPTSISPAPSTISAPCSMAANATPDLLLA